MPSSTSWGIGDIDDLPRMARWLGAAGLRLLQLLPLNEMPSRETSPYSALSAMAIDPQFIALDRLEDFAGASEGRRFMSERFAQLEAVRRSPTIDYPGVRRLKRAALRLAFERFRDTEWARGSQRADAFRAYIAQESWWLDDYALFRALHAAHGEAPWTAWPAPLRDREAGALSRARAELADDMLYRQYVQWVADDQWAAARRDMGGVAVYGDVPFMVGGDSADVWARQAEFRLDASVGTAPDAFSATGQDWGLPVYRWEVFEERDFDWLRDRARRNAALFDGYRVDHLVGFYRTYFLPRDGSPPRFTPSDEPAQRQLGERVLGIFSAAGADVIAEDLGTVPDFVRESLARLAIPGYRLFRWERQWHEPGQPYIDPVDYPPVSVATSGTHDTEPLATWWEGAAPEVRAAVLAVPSLAARLGDEDRAQALQAPCLPPALLAALLETLYASGSDLLILPFQDLFGWRDRINQPATVGAANWTWRLPWPVDRLSSEPAGVAAAAQLREWARRHGR